MKATFNMAIPPITPLEEQSKLAEALGLQSTLYFKREDLHPLGSHKGRSIPLMIKKYAEGGHRHFAISGSGNASIAAAMTINEYNNEFGEQPLDLRIFVTKSIDQGKLGTLESLVNENVRVEEVERPKQTVHKMNKSGEAKSLRQSKDDLALAGYVDLADELLETSPAAIFCPTSSGTTAEALAGHLPDSQMHVAQTTKCHVFAEQFDSNFNHTDTSLAGAIVDIVGERNQTLIPLIKKTQGGGWVLDNSAIKEAQALTYEHAGLELSPNSALSVAALKKALDSGWKPQPDKPIVCLITGP